MLKFRVSFWYEEIGETEIEASDAKEAEQKVQDQLEEKGLLELTFKTKDRDYGIGSSEEIK